MRYKHVLAAVDLTDEASQVLAKAQKIAESDGAKLSLITVIKPVNYAYAGLVTASLASITTNFEDEASIFAKTKQRELAQSANIPDDHLHVFLGSPAGVIKNQSEALEVDLIVIGSHGRHGLGTLLGSTANGVLHGATQDVLAVRVS